MYHILPKSEGNIIGVHVIGRMRRQDYETLLPFIEDVIHEHGTIRIVSDLRDFKGIEVLGVLKTLPFAFKYASHVEKEAVITDKGWVYTWAKILSPFFKTEVRCFPHSKVEEAWEWIKK